MANDELEGASQAAGKDAVDLYDAKHGKYAGMKKGNVSETPNEQIEKPFNLNGGK